MRGRSWTWLELHELNVLKAFNNLIDQVSMIIIDSEKSKVSQNWRAW